MKFISQTQDQSAISIIPFIDAPTIGINSQITRLEQVLENDMLEDRRILADGTIPIKDKELIDESTQYLGNMNRLKDLPITDSL
jgi:uncharacterized circularly permuted ATP-grasp superfamily protein